MLRISVRSGCACMTPDPSLTSSSYTAYYVRRHRQVLGLALEATCGFSACPDASPRLGLDSPFKSGVDVPQSSGEI
jgi:hypothetical protein